VGCVNKKQQKNILGTMKGWKKYSPLVEINSNSTLQQLQKGLIDNGHILRELLEAVNPDADAVCSAVEEIKFQLEDHPVDISDQWVTAHVMVGDKKKLFRNVSFVK
jgi:hypothetical protein